MSRGSLDWSDPLAVSQWLGALRVTLGDHLAVVDDMLRPPRERALGPALHRERVGETATQLRQLLDAATAHEPGDEETGDPEGKGGTEPAH
jgi:hypothetical protein